MKYVLSIILVVFFTSCQKKQKVDSIVINANVYTVNEKFDKAESFAIKDGKFVEIGSSEDIQNSFEADTIVDAKNQTIVPGFIDAHCHFYGLGLDQKSVNLVGTKSFDEVVQRIVDFQNENDLKFIKGFGWDQNDWDVKEFPNNKLLNALFPETPISITRIDGHAILCNQAALELGNVNTNSKIEGGEVVLENGELTGVLVDNAEFLVMNFWPKVNRDDTVEALLDAQKICTNLGLTTVDDAGLNRNTIEIIDSLQQAGDLKIRVYAMVSASKKNLDYYLNKGIIKTDKLNVRSFKFYSDGALGSRGALLKESYSDSPNTFGLPVTSLEDLESDAQRVANSEYQMNTHAIGDSANHIVLQTYKKVLQGQSDRRWRIEHAQVVSPKDFQYFDDIIPSIQPTHATSDMYWAEDRVGAERIKGAYAFKDLLNVNGRVALGTDFPVEHVSPFYTFYAAVARKDLEGYPDLGYQMENALTREEALKGMTIWAAYSNFEENEKGSIEVGKFADFIILNEDIMEVEEAQLPYIEVVNTFIEGEAQKK
ncbi:amidohydrolase [Yeosuana sp. MJ-SS3]|uniref:Amidohydrolase n=1 Tax=Gilvirhabdus luticola TaxID=3079858 RepID=A0ABU3U4P5_9FLAO|nr:amidohydrolase [Yeosuana sp. MJ-SS3]MDU8885376.1 amidohydrolase [Yeosuana sp. MJ-SS3]